MLVAVCPGRFHYNFLILETMKILKSTIIRLISEQSACPSQVELFEESLSEAREALRRQKALSESVRICQMPCKIVKSVWVHRMLELALGHLCRLVLWPGEDCKMWGLGPLTLEHRRTMLELSNPNWTKICRVSRYIMIYRDISRCIEHRRSSFFTAHRAWCILVMARRGRHRDQSTRQSCRGFEMRPRSSRREQRLRISHFQRLTLEL